MLAVLGVGDVLRVERSGVTNDRELVFMGVSERDGVERVEGSRVKLWIWRFGGRIDWSSL